MKGSQKKAPTVSATLDEDTFGRIERAAKLAGTTTSEFIRTLLTFDAMTSTSDADLAREYFGAKAATARLRSDALGRANAETTAFETGVGDVAEVSR